VRDEPLAADHVLLHGQALGVQGRPVVAAGQLRSRQVQHAADTRPKQADLAVGDEPLAADHVLLHGQALGVQGRPVVAAGQLRPRQVQDAADTRAGQLYCGLESGARQSDIEGRAQLRPGECSHAAALDPNLDSGCLLNDHLVKPAAVEEQGAQQSGVFQVEDSHDLSPSDAKRKGRCDRRASPGDQPGDEVPRDLPIF
jgi:hypothetical protein